MKQTISVIVIFLVMAGVILSQTLPADAAKKASKKKGLSAEVLTEITEKTDNLTKKIYEKELYTPQDANDLISIKLQLDEQMDTMPEASFAPLYYKLGNIFRLRGAEADAINCYQTVLENFSQTAYAPKSRDILEQMGVEIKLPVKTESEDEEEI